MTELLNHVDFQIVHKYVVYVTFLLINFLILQFFLNDLHSLIVLHHILFLIRWLLYSFHVLCLYFLQSKYFLFGLKKIWKRFSYCVLKFFNFYSNFFEFLMWTNLCIGCTKILDNWCVCSYSTKKVNFLNCKNRTSKCSLCHLSYQLILFIYLHLIES